MPVVSYADEAPKNPPDTMEERFIKGDIIVSGWLDDLATKLDLFLVGKRLTNRMNETSFKLENSTYHSKLTGWTDAPSVAVNLRLPNLEQYWNLKFTSYDETREKSVQESQLRQTPREKNYGATIGLLQSIGDVQAAFEPRIQLQDPFSITHQLTFFSDAPFKNGHFHPKIQFYAAADRGTGMFQSFNFYFHLSDVYSLGEINEGDYVDKTHTYSVSNGLSLGHALARNKTLTYSAFFDSNNQPSYHLESYHIAVTYYQSIYRNILDYSITPQLNFEKAVDFGGDLALTINISLNF